jgi:FAD dependent oxidoreductase TIGR03364
MPYDVAIVGAGICGLAHALAAARLGKRIVVIDRDAQANGASIRNFGFVTITGQARGKTWERARRSRDIWVEVAAKAGIPILHRGLAMVARRPEARAVLEEFMATEMAEGCALLAGSDIAARFPMLHGNDFAAALDSPHELRVESRTVIPALATWLEQEYRVVFLRETAVREVAPPRVETSRGTIEAETAIVCPGDDLCDALSERIAAMRVVRCKLHAAAHSDGGWLADERGRHVRSGHGALRGYAACPLRWRCGAV